MKRNFVRWLSALLIAMFLLSSTALMETENSVEVPASAEETAMEEAPTQNEEVPDVEPDGDDPMDEGEATIDVETIDAPVEVSGEADLGDDASVASEQSEEEIEASEAMLAGSEGVKINDEANFPDEAFRAYVSDEFDWDSDGSLSEDERNSVEYIAVEKKGISSLKGIEFFPELRVLYCADNQLTTLDVSKNTALKDLDCSHNQLKELDVSKNTALKNLYCGDNKLTVLNVSKNTVIERLGCGSNQLTTLDVSKNTGLKWLSCDKNNLTELDVSKNTALETLGCVENPLKTLDVSNCPFILTALQKGARSEEEGKVKWDYAIPNTEGYFLYVDAGVTVTPAVTPAGTSASDPAPASAPAPIPMPTIAAVKKSGKATVYAAPGAVYQLDLGGAVGKKFKSSKKKVATVDQNGLVTVKKAGKTKITFKVGKKKRAVTLKIVDPTVPKSIAIVPVATAVKKGDVITLTAVLPDGTNSPIKWKSSNKKVASVANGVVTFKKNGKVTITATATRGKKKAKVKFKVSK